MSEKLDTIQESLDAAISAFQNSKRDEQALLSLLQEGAFRDLLNLFDATLECNGSVITIKRTLSGQDTIHFPAIGFITMVPILTRIPDSYFKFNEASSPLQEKQKGSVILKKFFQKIMQALSN